MTTEIFEERSSHYDDDIYFEYTDIPIFGTSDETKNSSSLLSMNDKYGLMNVKNLFSILFQI